MQSLITVGLFSYSDDCDEVINTVVDLCEELRNLFGGKQTELPNGQIILWTKFEYLSDEHAMRGAAATFGPKGRLPNPYLILKRPIKLNNNEKKGYSIQVNSGHSKTEKKNKKIKIKI